MGREGGGGGSPEPEDLARATSTRPPEEGGTVQRRIVVLALAAALAATIAPVAGAILVRVRVEGASTTLYGAEQPRVTPFTGTLTQGDFSIELSRPTALGALETASAKGEIYYRLVTTSFGPFVAQIGRLSGEGSSGWVYKVNGA